MNAGRIVFLRLTAISIAFHIYAQGVVVPCVRTKYDKVSDSPIFLLSKHVLEDVNGKASLGLVLRAQYAPEKGQWLCI